MSRMEGAQVLFFEPCAPKGSNAWKEPGRKVRPGIIVYTLPPEGSDLPGPLGRYLRQRGTRFLQDKLEHHRFKEPVFWCATPAGAEYLDSFAYRGLVYDCARDWKGAWGELEQMVVPAADVVFAASPDLAQKLMPLNANVTLLPQGCNYPMFARDDLPRPLPLRGLKGPVFGFLGTLWPDLDLVPLRKLASSRPDCHIVLVGRDAGCAGLPELLEEPNVRYLGQAETVDLPDYLSSFDACLYLLRESETDSDIIHARLFEYLSTGRPVVAMLRPDQVEHFPDVVYAAHSPAEFAMLCSRSLDETGTWARDRRRAYGQAASWSNRAGEVNRILESIGLFS